MTASKAISSRTAPDERPPASGGSSSSIERFRLDGPSRRLDPLFNAYRRDLADIALAGQVLAPHYARPLLRSCGAQATMIRSEPDPDGPALSELLPGEAFAVLEYAGGWAWGYCPGDGLVGYVEAIELSAPFEATHIVCEKCAPVAADDSITSPVLASLPMGSLLHGEEDGACLATEYGCVSASHLRPMAEPEQDPATVAERLIGVPWLAGGRSFHGVDSAGLVQLSLALCGLPAPRLDQAQRRLGTPVAEGDPLCRGDLVFFPGGGGLMIDDLLMIHASREAGKVTVEPFALRDGADAVRRRLPGSPCAGEALPLHRLD